jgi:light-regulated signal transduction histidine kinase (bacteriophytochrome)
VTQLSSSIDTLVAQLQQRDRELSGLSDSLDARVDQQTLSLRKRNEDLQSFSRSVTHDLKGPIGSMGMLLRHVIKEEGARMGNAPRRLLSEVSRECDRLTTLIDELMTLAMVEQRPMLTQPVLMGALVEQVVAELRASHHGVHVEVKIEELPTVHGDEVLLRQVWHNLISNAFKYSSKSPQPRVRIAAASAGNEVVFTVKDNGVGFDMARADRLFVVFQRLHRASEFQGTGVGLSIVKRAVQRHRGRVGARSAPGDGAEFFFALPVTDSAASPQEPQ